MYTPDPAGTFPINPSYGFTATPMYRVNIVEREGGFERINRVWSRPLLAISAVPIEDAPPEDIEEVLYFFHAMGGQSTYFRFKDWSDYQTSPFGIPADPLDQPLVPITSTAQSSPQNYQLMKYYQLNITTTSPITTITQVREIYKPIGSTVRVANEVGTEQPDTAWTIDESNGQLIPNGTFVGTPTSWGGEFDVEARFNQDISIEISTFGTRATSFTMREKRRAATT